MHSSRTWLTALSLLLLLAAAVRATVWWAHDPLLAYANNYDQIRTMAVLGVRPDAPGLADLDGGTPEQPWARFKTGLGWRMPFYPSSDTAIRAVVHVGSGLWRPGGSTMDIRQESAWLLAAWLLGVAWIGWRLLGLNAWHGLGFAAWVLLVTDPINLLFLNTWYAEFSAFACVTGLVWPGLAVARRVQEARWVVGGWMLAFLLVRPPTGSSMSTFRWRCSPTGLAGGAQEPVPPRPGRRCSGCRCRSAAAIQRRLRPRQRQRPGQPCGYRPWRHAAGSQRPREHGAEPAAGLSAVRGRHLVHPVVRCWKRHVHAS